MLRLTDDEAQRLEHLAGIRLLNLVEWRDTNHHHRGWAMRFAEQPNAQCPFLNEANLCDIYADRPTACRRFPTLPTAGCLVWPRIETGG